MFDKVIVGYDGRDGGKDAVALALQLAGGDAEIVLVTGFPHEEYPNRATQRDFERAMREDAEKILGEAAETSPRLRTHAEPGATPPSAIKHLAAVERADLIVIGSSHRGRLGRILMGDTAAAVMHDAPCPVLVAPKGYRLAAPAGAETVGT